MRASHRLIAQISERVEEGDRCLLDKVSKKYGDRDLQELAEKYGGDDGRLSEKLSELAELRRLRGKGTDLQLKDRRRLKKQKQKIEDY